MRIAGKVWVVTGAGSGMGAELARQLLDRGARVAAVDRELDGMTRLGDRPGTSLHVLDITDADGVRALPQQVIDAHGQVDGLINNAGIIQPFVHVADLDDAAIERVMAVSFGGTLAMCRASLPQPIARPEAHLANVSSMGGFFPFPGQTIYGASKAAVRLLTEGLFTELVDTGVDVSVIFPGAVDTGITSNSGISHPEPADGASVPMLSAPRAAKQMLDGLERGKLHIHVGTDSKLMSAATKVSPRRAYLFVQKQMAARLG